MKKILIITSAIVTYLSGIQAIPLDGITFFSPRSQSTNAAKELVGWHKYIWQDDMTNFYSAFTVTPSYNLSSRPDRIAHALFGAQQLIVSGSGIINRGERDFLADYFGLSPKFYSIVQIKPHIRNIAVTFDGFFGFDKYAPGLFLELHVPVVWTKSHLSLHENIISTATNSPFPPLYNDFSSIISSAGSFKEALLGTTTFGQLQTPLQFGKVDGPLHKHGLSDVQCMLGYNFVLRPYEFAGIGLRIAAPTGSRPTSEFLFEPIVGNGKHWEAGISGFGRALLWERDSIQQLMFLWYVNFMHLFNAQQRRSFDLVCNRIASRYELIKEFDAFGNYTGILLPAINVTTFDCMVKVDFQMDLVAMFSYSHYGLLCDAGYEGWIRSKEKIELRCNLPTEQYALKGIQNVFNSNGSLSNATQSNATIFGNEFTDQTFVVDVPSPVFLTPDIIDRHSAASPLVITHKFFANVSYGWEDLSCIIPFIGVGGEVEFEGINTRERHVFHNNTMSQWGIWLKGGCRF